MSDAQDIILEDAGTLPRGLATTEATAPVTGSTAQVTADAGATAPTRPPLARLYMTSDLRAATGLSRTHMDFYLREGLTLPTARTESGYLLFDDAELETLRAVIALRQAGLGIREIRVRIGR